ncbi:succinate dehydrogenase assembly factor 2-B, mitochondrial isoform X2 [Drosophila kikkawai]|uniref:Succinate dehydrogenase assembly factor 2, mitochondrial n=1 Tax=Drosophila kikkawai TaxID=30033 RepID=A0A6P4IAX9_DROKI|nr:succinate dehydrogenase assembly factor 2-B, mitochondrial [Drosophila kikkawai]
MLRQFLVSTVGRRLALPMFAQNRSASNLDKTEFTTPGEIVDYDDPPHLPVPEYPARPDEPLETRKQRLLYQSRKRGMLENDLLLSTFVAKFLKDFNADQTAQYDRLINGVSNDWDIFYWATETKPTPPEFDTEIMRMLKEHVKNAEKVQRIRQPDL